MSEEIDILNEKTTVLEGSLKKIKSLAKTATIISIIVGGGGIFSIVKYSLEYRDHKTQTKNEIHTAEINLLEKNIDFYEKHGKTELVNKYVRLHESLNETYYKPKIIVKPILEDISIKIPQLTFEEKKKEQILENLPNASVENYIGLVNSDGNLDYSKNNEPIKIGEVYEVTYDYSQYRFDEVKSTLRDSINQVQYKIGFGVRITCRFKILTNEFYLISFDNLYSIAKAAASSKIQGTITMETIGIAGSSIFSLIPLPSDISSISIQEYMSAINKIMLLIPNKNTFIRPQIMSVKGPAKIIDKIN